MNKGLFKKGIIDGLPICFGYLSVAFAFSIFAVGGGLNPFYAVIISMTNVTSAGQLAAVPLMLSGGSLIEMAATQFVINMRYALMSVSLSQKLGKDVKLFDKLIISFVNTDEVFAVAVSKKESLSKHYLYGLILMPYLGWSAGTAIGAIAGDILPAFIISALGIAIYGMFIAIVLPVAKKDLPTLVCVIISVALGCAFKFIPALKVVPGGFVIIICAVLASLILAAAAPRDITAESEEIVYEN